MHAMVNLWRSEDSFIESGLSTHLQVDSGDRTQVTRLAQQVPLPTGPSCLPPLLGHTYFSPGFTIRISV